MKKSMKIQGISFAQLKREAVYNEEVDAYVYKLGTKIEVTSTKKAHVAEMLAKYLSSNLTEDELMIKYCPSNRILIDTDLLESVFMPTEFSCVLDEEAKALRLGKVEKYRINSGVLVMSGKLSANGMIESHNEIKFGSRYAKEGVIGKARLLGVAWRHNKLFGIIHVPRERGLSVSADSEFTCYSLVNSEKRSCLGLDGVTIEDWFDGSKIVLVEEGDE